MPAAWGELRHLNSVLFHHWGYHDLDNTTRVSNFAAGMLLAITTIPLAALAETGPRYTYVTAGYLNTEIDDEGFLGEDPDGDGFAIGGSVAVTDMVHLFAGYSISELEVFSVDVDYDTLNVGLGVNYPIADQVDLVGRISFVEVEFDVDGFGSEDESGYGLSAGVRAMVTEQLEVNGFVNYLDLGSDADDTTVAIGALYNFTEMFAAGIGAEFGGDIRTISAGVRLYIGKP